jgi:cytochrome P460
MKRTSMLTIASVTALLAVLAAEVAISAQDKYILKLPNGLSFSEFRGYENWQVVSVSQTAELLKVEVANPTMIEAYRSGIPGNGKPFPDGSKIAKIEWKPKKMLESPFAVNVPDTLPDTLQDVFLIEKDSKRFPDTKGWAYAVFDYQPASDTFTPDPTGTVNCGFACHTVVKDKDYIFHSYQKRWSVMSVVGSAGSVIVAKLPIGVPL